MAENIKINCITDFIHTIEQIKFTYDLEKNPMNILLYRGASKNSYKMIPSLFRTFSNSLESKFEHRKYVNEYEMYMHFIKEGKAFVKNLDDNTNMELLEWVVYAQHFGVPTRLLDFTTNPLVALYFACCSNKDDDGVVWIINLQNYNNFLSKSLGKRRGKNREELIYGILNYVQASEDECLEYPIHFFPYYLDERMSSQSSVFLLWGKKESAFEDMFGEKHKMNIDLAEQGISVDYLGKKDEFLLKITIPKEAKKKIFYELDLFGVNAKIIFPGLDGLGKYIENHYNCSGRSYGMKIPVINEKQGENK